MRNAISLSVALASILVSGCITMVPKVRGQADAQTELRSQKIHNATFNSVAMAYMGAQVGRLNDEQFVDLSRRLIPGIQHELSARKVAGLKADPSETEQFARMRATASDHSDSVYSLFHVTMGKEAVSAPLAGFSSKGEHATYSARDGGVVFVGSIDMKRKSNDFPFPTGWSAAEDSILSAVVSPRKLTVIVPMAEDAFKMSVYNAARAGSHFLPAYDLLVVFKPTPCVLDRGLVCQMQVVSTRVFGSNGGAEIPGAIVKVE